MMKKGENLLIAGGGTGGHLFPGIAVGDRFLARNPDNRVMFVTSGRPMDKKLLDNGPFEHRIISVSGVKGMGLFKKLSAVMKLPAAVLSSMGLIFSFKPDIVLGVGGYASGPVGMAARLMGAPLCLHEQNVLPGITNRLLFSHARRVFESFPGSFQKEMEKKGEKHRNKTVFTGNPVRKELLDARAERKDDIFTVLVLGGSQGAHAVNTAVMEALPFLNRESVRLIHQTGEADLPRVRKAFEDHQINGVAEPFFFDMATLYHAADLIISRAGATTTAELTSLGKAVVFIPFPHAADDHQMKNARMLEAEGAALVIPENELTGEKLAQVVNRFSMDRKALESMAEKAKAFGKPEAADTIVELCYELMNR